MIKPNNLLQTFSKVLVAIALIAGFTLTTIGFSSFSWPRPIPWSDAESLVRFFGFLSVAAIFVVLLANKLNRNVSVAAFIAIALLAMGAGALWPISVAIWFALSSSILGQWFLGRLKIKSGNWVISFLIGSGIYGTSIGLLAHFPFNYPGIYGIALAIPIFLGLNILRAWFNEFAHWVNQIHRISDRSNYWLDVSIAIVALVFVAVALMPEIGHDALVSHLFVPAHLLERHQWGFDARTYVWAVMPMLGDWIFSIAYLLGGETAARLINVFFIFVLGWLVRDLVLWAGGSMLGARWAILIFLSSPLTFAEGNSLFIDSIWATFAVAGMFYVLKACSNDEGQKNQLPIAGALLGCALAAKAVTLTLLPVLLLILVLKYKTWFRQNGVIMLLLGLGLFLMIGGIPYITAWWLTGNPVFPFFNQIFHSPLWPISNFEDTRWSKGLSWDFIYRATFETGKYLESTPGAAGFQWLLMFLPVLVILIVARHRRGIFLVLLAVLSIFLCFQSTAYLRYVFPAYALLIAVIGVGVTTILKTSIMQSKFLYGFGAITVILNMFFLSAGPFVYRDFPIKSIFSEANKEEYLAHRLPVRNAVKLVNALNLQRTPVAVFGTTQIAGLTADALHANWYNHSWLEAFMAVQTTQGVAELLLKNHVDFIITDSSASEQKVQRALLDSVTIDIAQFGSIHVLRLKNDLRFKRELLINPDFIALKGWSLNGEAHYDAESRTIVASATSPVTQRIEVNSRQRYKNTVVARCYKGIAQGRVQVNWQDSKEEFIQPDIQLFTCSADWQEVSMDVIAPADAATAYVYATGHTSTPIEFKSISFKQ